MSGDQSELFADTSAHDSHGAIWWAGNWQCRNWHGYLQHREGGSGNWCFIIHSFGGDPDGEGTAWVHRIEGKEAVPIDANNRLLIRGRRYGRSHWHH